MARGTVPHATETSPLLSHTSDAYEQPRRAIDPRTSVIHDEADTCDEHTSSGSSEDDGGSVERRASNGDTSKHQGMPEVKKRMKYIFPAVAIGVCTRPPPRSIGS
jgi:hypothetical protein